MYSQFFRKLAWFVFGLTTCASAQRTDSCTGLMKFKDPGVEITKATPNVYACQTASFLDAQDRFVALVIESCVWTRHAIRLLGNSMFNVPSATVTFIPRSMG